MRTKTDDYINLELDTMMYRIMVSEVCDPVQTSYRVLDISLTTNIWTFISIGTDTGFQRGFHCVILDLKDLLSHLFEE